MVDSHNFSFVCFPSISPCNGDELEFIKDVIKFLQYIDASVDEQKVLSTFFSALKTFYFFKRSAGGRDRSMKWT